MKNKSWILLTLILAILGSLYSIVMVMFWAVNEMFSFNFWNALICAMGWSFFGAALSDLMSQKVENQNYDKEVKK